MSTSSSIEQRPTTVQRIASKAKNAKKGKNAAKRKKSKSPVLCGKNMIIHPLSPTIENWEACEWIARLAGASTGNK